MSQNSFLLVVIDRHDGQSTPAGRPTGPSPFPALHEVLGVTASDLRSLRFRGVALFEDPPPTAHHGPASLDDYLTVVTLRTIVHQRFPGLVTLPVLGRDLLDPRWAPPAPVGRCPVAVGISTTFAFAPEAVASVAGRLRTLFPDTPIVVGGAGTTLNPGWVAAANADFGVLGDAEESLPLLLEFLMTGSPAPAAIPNLVFRDETGRFVHSPRTQFPIDRTPTPRWDLAHDGRWPRTVWYESERGCPFRCAFCSYPNQALAWVVKSPERMIEEFEYYASRGVDTIECYDSTMVTPPARMATFTKLARERGLRVRWHCYAHAANLQDPRLLLAMQEAGCRSVSIGVESCDASVLQRMRKVVSPASLRRAVANCTEAGLVAAANIIVGFPGETVETYQRTVDGLVELQPDTVGIQAFQIRDRTIPILRMENANLEVGEGARPYWKHDGMDQTLAVRLAQEAMWHLAVRAEKTIVPEVGTAARAPMPMLDDREASRFRREFLNPVINAYGRFLCFDPRLRGVDAVLCRPHAIPGRSSVEAARHVDAARRGWERAVATAAKA